MPYEVTLSTEGDVTMIRMKGTMVGPNDRSSFQSQIQEIVDGGQLNLILDLGEVNFVDSSGIGGLIAAASLAGRRGGIVKLLNVTKRIHDVLQITRLSSVFEIFDSSERALASFGNQS